MTGREMTVREKTGREKTGRGMMGRGVIIAVLALMLPLPALAQDGRFDGDWALGDPMACDLSGHDTANFALRIRGDRFRGLESECRMTNPVTLPGVGAVIHEMECTGEGESWSYHALMMLDREGQLVMISDGSARIYPRCEGFSRPQPDQTSAPVAPQ